MSRLYHIEAFIRGPREHPIGPKQFSPQREFHGMIAHDGNPLTRLIDIGNPIYPGVGLHQECKIGPQVRGRKVNIHATLRVNAEEGNVAFFVR